MTLVVSVVLLTALNRVPVSGHESSTRNSTTWGSNTVESWSGVDHRQQRLPKGRWEGNRKTRENGQSI
jgi:hypothetical protein